MTPAEQNLLAEGKNFEHSGGAVATSKLEILFLIYREYQNVIRRLKSHPNLQNRVIPFFFIFAFTNFSCRT